MRWGRGWDPIEWPLGARTAPGRRSQTDQRRPASEGSANEAHLLAWPASQEPPGSVAPMPPSHRSHRATGPYRRILAADAEESLKNLYRIAEEGQPGSTSRDRAALLPLSRLLATRDTLALAPGRRLWIRCGRGDPWLCWHVAGALLFVVDFSTVAIQRAGAQPALYGLPTDTICCRSPRRHRHTQPRCRRRRLHRRPRPLRRSHGGGPPGAAAATASHLGPGLTPGNAAETLLDLRDLRLALPLSRS